VGLIDMDLDSGRRVVARCEQAGVLAYFPMFRQIEIESGRRRTRIHPLWPGYIFVQDASARWIRGVAGFLKTEIGYSRMRDSVLRALCFDQHDSEGFVTLRDEPPEARFEMGHPVRVMGSPFSTGMWNGMSPDGRHRVLYSLLGRPAEALVEDALLLDAAA
jgi:transcription antitermination factor NusG